MNVELDKDLGRFGAEKTMNTLIKLYGWEIILRELTKQMHGNNISSAIVQLRSQVKDTLFQLEKNHDSVY